jgi:hypothetical protein
MALALGAAAITMLLFGWSCHHSSVSGGVVLPFEFSESVLDGNFGGAGLWVSPQVGGPGKDYITLNEELVTDGLGAFTITRTTNTNGVITESEEVGTYEIDQEGIMTFQFDGDVTLEGSLTRDGQLAFLVAKEIGQDPGFTVYLKRGEPGSYMDKSMFDGIYYLTGFAYDLQKPNKVFGGSTRTGLDFDFVSGTTAGTISWSKWDFGAGQGTVESITYQNEAFILTDDGELTIKNYPMPAPDGEPPGALRYYDLVGTVSEDGRMAVVSTKGVDDNPIFAVLYKQGGVHSIDTFYGDFFGLGLFYYYGNAQEVSVYLEANFDGMDIQGEGGFSATYRNIFPGGLAEGLVEGKYLVGGLGGFEFYAPFFNPPLEGFSGGIMEDDKVGGGVTPKGNVPGADPGMIFYFSRYVDDSGGQAP